MIEIKSPAKLEWDIFNGAIFLGGSIEMGLAEDWQPKLIAELANYEIAVLNPRRDNWDPTWVQSIKNPKFKEQVQWELSAIDHANIVVFYFDPDTKSPITLMELGLCAGQGSKTIVCCPDGYWRKGNVEILCEMYNIKLVETFNDFVTEIKLALLVIY